MDARYTIEDTGEIISPAVVLFRDIMEETLGKMIDVAGDPARLRPHCKTHKMREVIALQLKRGIAKHKCATFAEAEMLADTGVTDIFLAYSLVGPNIARAVRFVEKYPDVTFAVTADHAGIDLIKDGLAFLSDDDRQWLLRKTAERVLFHK